MKKRILIFCDFYLPSLGGGGGMFAVANIVERFSDRYDFYVVAGNRNVRESNEPIANILEDEWNDIGSARVYFTSTKSLKSAKASQLFGHVRPDAVLLNSVFSTPTIRFLRARMQGAIPNVPVILAPCGELMPNALEIKSWKKRVYLTFARSIGLYRNLIWRASSVSEAKTIRTVFGKEATLKIAPDLTPRTILSDFDQRNKPKKFAGHAKFAFLARILPNKNLSFFLERLIALREGNIELDIIGPIEDRSYWEQCLAMIDKLPENTRVNIVGAVPNDEALRRLVDSHYFVLPTITENFGFVFLEAAAAGCPLLISDRTDWGKVQETGGGWILSLDEQGKWIEQINHCVRADQQTYDMHSRAARDFAVNWLADPAHEAATADLLKTAVNSEFVVST